MSATRTKSLCKSLVAVTACAAGVTGATGIAEAANPDYSTIKTAKFKASLSGSQVTTWEYHSPPDEDPCTAKIDAFGDQTIKFNSKGRRVFNVTFSTPPKGQPNFFSTAGRPAVSIEPFILNLPATAERNGDETIEPGSTAACDGPNGGGVDPREDLPKDCGVRTGRISPDLYFYDRTADDDLLVPLTEDLPSKNMLKLEGRNYEWLHPSGEDGSSSLDSVYERCPIRLDARVPDAGQIYTSPARINEKRLFNRKRRNIVISGHHIVNHNSRGTTGKTILAWNLRLTRIKK
jgi:hypothetical protein